MLRRSEITGLSLRSLQYSEGKESAKKSSSEVMGETRSTWCHSREKRISESMESSTLSNNTEIKTNKSVIMIIEF